NPLRTCLIDAVAIVLPRDKPKTFLPSEPEHVTADRPEPRRPDSSRRLEPDLQLVSNESRFGNGMAEPKAKQREQGGKLATASKATIQHAEPPPGADPSRKACCGKNSAGQRLRRASHQSGPTDH